jgi:hypothetical protein
MRNALLLIATAVVATSGGSMSTLRTRYRELSRSVLQTDSAKSRSPVLTESDIAGLPAPVRRYVARSGAIGHPRPHSVTAEFDARMWRKPGAAPMHLRTHQTNRIDEPERHFFLEGSMFGLPIRGLHTYHDARATMLVRVAGLFPVARAEGAELDRAETVTILNDMCILAPGALIDPRLSWTEVDSSTVDVVFTNGPHRVRARLSFDDRGDLVNFVSDDRAALQDDGTLKPMRWSTPLEGWHEVDGRRIPTWGRTVYDYPLGPFTYGEFRFVSVRWDPVAP